MQAVIATLFFTVSLNSFGSPFFLGPGSDYLFFEATLARKIGLVIQQKLLPVLYSPINEALLTENERTEISRQINNGLPIHMVNPKELEFEPDRYRDPQGLVAPVANGRLRDNSGKDGQDVDSRIVIDTGMESRMSIQMDLVKWTQYTGYGTYFPDYLMTHLFHEVLRYCYTVHAIARNDDNYAISKKLVIPQKPRGRTDAGWQAIKYFEPSNSTQPFGIYSGTVGCQATQFHIAPENSPVETPELSDELDGRCYVEVEFPEPGEFTTLHKLGSESRTLTAYYSYRPVMEPLTPKRLGKPKQIHVTAEQTGNLVTLRRGNGSLQLRLDRSSQILTLSGQPLFLERDRPKLAGKVYRSPVSCEIGTLDLLMGHEVRPLSEVLKLKGDGTCELEVAFLDEKRVSLQLEGIDSGHELMNFEARYAQIGRNILVRSTENAVGSFIYLQTVNDLADEIQTNTGQILRLENEVAVQWTESTNDSNYIAYMPCGHARLPVTLDIRICQVQMKLEKPKQQFRGRVRFGITFPHEKEKNTTWTLGSYQRVNHSVQIWLLGSQQPISFKTTRSGLIHQEGYPFNLLEAPIQTAQSSAQ